MHKLLTCIFIFFISFNAISKNKIIYLDPKPNAEFVNIENAIIIGFENPVLTADKTPINSIVIKGERSGFISSSVVYSSDKTKIIIKPASPFSAGEKVTVAITGNFNSYLGLNSGITYSFYTSPEKIYSDETVNFDDKTCIQHQTDFYSKVFAEPVLSVTVNNNPSPGYLFLTPNIYSYTYLQIYTNTGSLYWSQYVMGTCMDLKKQPNGNLTYFDGNSKRFIEYNENYQTVNYYQCGNGYTTDNHELRVLSNGHAYLMAYDSQYVDMSKIIQGGNPNALVVGLIIQEIDNNKNVVFQWRSWDYFQITDATYENLLAGFIDYVHGNAIEIDTDNNIILSSRNMDEITKINRTTGDIIWRLGGKNNQFTFVNDSIGFSHQHAIRRTSNGNFTLFDNGNFHNPQFSRALEYNIDEVNKVVTKVWEYRRTPSVYSSWGGYVQRLDNGNTLIGWGGAFPTVTEVTQQGVKVFEAVFNGSYYSYRAFKYPWGTPTSISSNTETPNKFELHQNYPNPFNPLTKIKFSIPAESFTELIIYDIAGRVIERPVREVKQAGDYEIVFDGYKLASGLYFYKLTSGNYISVKKMMLIK